MASHVITNVEAHLADKKDSQCLPQVLEHTIENLHAEGLIVEELLGDGGYSSGEALKAWNKMASLATFPTLVSTILYWKTSLIMQTEIITNAHGE